MEESCSLQKLVLDPNPNIKRGGRGKKASIKYKRMVREENETWWLPLNWLDRVVNFAWEISISKGAGSAPFPLHRMADELLGAPRHPQDQGKSHPQLHADTSRYTLYIDIVCSLSKLFLKRKNLVKKNESKAYQNKALSCTNNSFPEKKEEARRGPKADRRRPGVSARKKLPIGFLIIVLIGK